MDNPQPTPQNQPAAREGAWAKPVEHLNSTQVKADINLNVDGKAISGPLRGFGQMWQKTYTIKLTGASATPQQVIQTWKENFGSFWPKENRFYAAGSKIAVNEVAVLNLAGPFGMQAPGGRGMVSTGVLVIYEDDVSFSFITPDGHIFAAMITFSASDEDGLKAQVQALVRASDPLFELGARLGVVHQMEDRHWHRVLQNLATHFGAQGKVEQKNELIDPRLQWAQAGNLRNNSAIHTALYLAGSPFRWAAGLFRKK